MHFCLKNFLQPLWGKILFGYVITQWLKPYRLTPMGLQMCSSCSRLGLQHTIDRQTPEKVAPPQSMKKPEEEKISHFPNLSSPPPPKTLPVSKSGVHCAAAAGGGRFITFLFHSRLSVCRRESDSLIGSLGRCFFLTRFVVSCRLLHLSAKLQPWWARLGPVPSSLFWLAWESWAKRHKRSEDFKNIPPRRVSLTQTRYSSRGSVGPAREETGLL